MDLKRRLKIAFIIIITLPILMMALSGKVIVEYLNAAVQHTYNIDADTIQVITNPLRILNRVTREAYNQIKLCAIREPEKFEDMGFIEQMNAELSLKYSYLMLRKGDKIIYYGGDGRSEEIEGLLPEFGEHNTDLDGGIYVGEKRPVLIKHQDFFFSDGSEGSIFIITEVNVLMPQLKNSLIHIII